MKWYFIRNLTKIDTDENKAIYSIVKCRSIYVSVSHTVYNLIMSFLINSFSSLKTFLKFIFVAVYHFGQDIY